MGKLISLALALITVATITGGFNNAIVDIDAAISRSDTSDWSHEADSTVNAPADDEDYPENDDDTPADDDASYEEVTDEQEQMILDFVHRPGVNGFLCAAGDWPSGVIPLREVVYQCQSDYYSHDEVAEAFERAGYELNGDLNCLTGDELDYLLWEITGYDLYTGTGEIQDCWDMSGLIYLEELDMYCVQHGDTNYQRFEIASVEYNGDYDRFYVDLVGRDSDSVFTYVDGEGEFCDVLRLSLWPWGEDDFEISWILAS